MAVPFRNVLRPKVGRSVFNLSYDKLFNGDMGVLYPVVCDEMLPGDVFRIGNKIVLRLMPMVRPIIHEINVYVHYFFAPYRILWPTTDPEAPTTGWEGFITGGPEGDQTPSLPEYSGSVDESSLWTYLGMPQMTDPPTAFVMAFPMYAYNCVWNYYYRDENLQDVVDMDDDGLKRRCWTADYFTTCLPWRQRGSSPSIPVTGFAEWDPDLFDLSSGSSETPMQFSQTLLDPDHANINNANARDHAEEFFNSNELSAVTADIADIRLATQVQKWLERNARSGVRYVEFLAGHYNVAPRDDRMQRPEYIGGTKCPVIISEVLSTANTEDGGSSGEPVGQMAGHGIAVDTQFACKYRAQEFGLVLGLLSVMPKAVYQQGINRQWLRETKFDFPFPEFANLSEQEVTRAEIYADDTPGSDDTLFGYQGRYDECRTKQSIISADMALNYTYWHMARIFSSAPSLNSTFVACNPRKAGIFVDSDEPAFVCNIGNLIKAARPLPFMADPGKGI